MGCGQLGQLGPCQLNYNLNSSPWLGVVQLCFSSVGKNQELKANNVAFLFVLFFIVVLSFSSPFLY